MRGLATLAAVSKAPYRHVDDDQVAVGLIHHGRYTAMFRTRLDAETFYDRLRYSRRTRRSDYELAPYPPPPDAAALLWRDTADGRVLLRHYSSYRFAPSPTVSISVEPETDTHHVVKAEFLPSAIYVREPGPGIYWKPDMEGSSAMALGAFIAELLGLKRSRHNYRELFVDLLDDICREVPDGVAQGPQG